MSAATCYDPDITILFSVIILLNTSPVLKYFYPANGLWTLRENVGTANRVFIKLNLIHVIPLSGFFLSMNSIGNRYGPKISYFQAWAVETRCSFGIVYQWLVVCFLQNRLLSAFIMLHHSTSYYEINFLDVKLYST